MAEPCYPEVIFDSFVDCILIGYRLSVEETELEQLPSCEATPVFNQTIIQLYRCSQTADDKQMLTFTDHNHFQKTAVRRYMFLRIIMIFIVCAVGFFKYETAMAIEEAKYTVIKKAGEFELRQYEPKIVAETFVEGDFGKVGNKGFRRLYGYISGGNRTKEEIAMTAPVTQEAISQKIAMTAPVGQEKVNGKWRITFVMPAQYSMDTLPKPLDPEVSLREVPGRLMAANRYSGTWSKTRYLKHEAQLQKWIKTLGLEQIGEPVFARHNPPYTPWFLRRNEVLIPVKR